MKQRIFKISHIQKRQQKMNFGRWLALQNSTSPAFSSGDEQQGFNISFEFIIGVFISRLPSSCKELEFLGLSIALSSS